MSQEQSEDAPVISRRKSLIRWAVSLLIAILLALLFLQIFSPNFQRHSPIDIFQRHADIPLKNNHDISADNDQQHSTSENNHSNNNKHEIPRDIIQQACAAAYEGKFSELQKLISIYPDLVFSRDDDQQATPLLWAVEKDHREIIDYLLQLGADINAQGQQGVSSLHRAALLGNESLVKYLLEHGAKVNIFDNTNATPLINAAGKGHLAVVRLLLRYHPDINAQESQGKWSALHAAILNKHADIVQLLLANGADVTAKNIFDMTPLQSARQTGDAKIVKLLQQAGARE